MTTIAASTRFGSDVVSPDLEHMQVRMKICQQENNALRQSLARMRNEYEELQDDSKFHKAKVSELEDLLEKSSGRGKKSEVLMYKTQENAELKLQVQSLQAKLRESNSQLETMNHEKQANKRLLLEMSSIVSTLSSVKIDYDVVMGSSYVAPQQMSIKNVKAKIEAIMNDRSLLVKHCKELEKECSQKDSKIHALESQFHIVNKNNLAKKGAVPMDDATLSTSYTISTKQSGSLATSPFDSPHSRNDDCSMDHTVLFRQQREQERTVEQMNTLKEELRQCQEEMEDAVIKRDEYKETLRQCISQYKELHAEVAMKDDAKKIGSQHQGDQNKPLDAENKPNAKDILAAYNKSLDKIRSLESRLAKTEGQVGSKTSRNPNDRRYRDAVAACKKMEKEKENFRILLDKAKFDTQNARKQVTKEKLEAKNLRRRLTQYLQGELSLKQHELSIPDLKSPVCPEELLLERKALSAENRRLQNENNDLTQCCEAIMKEMGA